MSLAWEVCSETTKSPWFDLMAILHVPRAWGAGRGLGRYTQSIHHSTRSACACDIVTHVQDKQHGYGGIPPERGLHTGIEAQQPLLLDHLSHNIHRARVRAKFVLEPMIANEPYMLRGSRSHRHALDFDELERDHDEALRRTRTAAREDGELLVHFRLSGKLEVCLAPEVICRAARMDAV